MQCSPDTGFKLPLGLLQHQTLGERRFPVDSRCFFGPSCGVNVEVIIKVLTILLLISDGHLVIYCILNYTFSMNLPVRIDR